MDLKSQRRVVHGCGWLALVFVVFVLSMVLGFGAEFTSAMSALITGWLNYPTRVLPQISWNASLILHGIIAAGLAAIGLHFLVRWIAAHRQRPWRWKWTFLIVLAVGLLFDAAIAMTGIIHQSTWLAREGISQPSRKEVQRQPNARRLGELYQALFSYAIEHGDFPPTLESLVPPESEIRAWWEREVLGSDSAHRPVYFPGLSNTSESTAVLLYSPVAGNSRDYLVTCVGGSTEIVPIEKLKERIARTRKAIQNPVGRDSVEP